jgi:hypothetical protein
MINNRLSYIERLQEHRAGIQAIKEATPAPLTLSERIDRWWRELPDEERRASYSMEFFRDYFGEGPARLGPVLFSLGWVRKRIWESGRPHRRVWTIN